MDRTDSAADTADQRLRLLSIYLNDHLAGSTTGLELFRRSARAHQGSELGATLERLAGEVEEDREALLGMIRALGVRVRQYKLYLAWAVERAGRLKFNGRVLQRSPLSSLVELETLRLGVEGKAAGFRTLRVVAERDSRLDTDRLELLIARAERQSQTLEQLRIQTASRLFGAG